MSLSHLQRNNLEAEEYPFSACRTDFFGYRPHFFFGSAVVDGYLRPESLGRACGIDCGIAASDDGHPVSDIVLDAHSQVTKEIQPLEHSLALGAGDVEASFFPCPGSQADCVEPF